MEPFIKNGSLVVTSTTKNINVGDVISFKNQYNEILTHRIVRILDTGSSSFFMVTKGDNNGNNDKETLSPNNVIGKVILIIPHFGKILYLMSYKKLLPFSFYLPCGLILGSISKKLIKI